MNCLGRVQSPQTLTSAFGFESMSEYAAGSKDKNFVARRNRITKRLFIEFDGELLISPDGKVIELDLERFGEPEEISESDLTEKQREVYQNKLKRSEEEAIEWLARKQVDADGYVFRRSASGRDVYEHRAVAEEILGRSLYGYEHVHHINGRRDDNDPENLCVLDAEAHKKYHEWFRWIVETYGNTPRRDTSLQELRRLKGILLADVGNKGTGT